MPAVCESLTIAQLCFLQAKPLGDPIYVVLLRSGRQVGIQLEEVLLRDKSYIRVTVDGVMMHYSPDVMSPSEAMMIAVRRVLGDML